MRDVRDGVSRILAAVNSRRYGDDTIGARVISIDKTFAAVRLEELKWFFEPAGPVTLNPCQVAFPCLNELSAICCPTIPRTAGGSDATRRTRHTDIRGGSQRSGTRA
jgi:hypothetical protein